jgi:transposase
MIDSSPVTKLEEHRMQVKTLLNRVEKIKSFVYGAVKIIEAESGPVMEVELRPRANSRPVCSGCGKKRPGYDNLAPRRFEFVPLWNMRVFFVYSMRRVDCPVCGVVVESVSWSDGKHQLTKTHAWFLAGWAKRMSWAQVAEAFRTSWHHVFCSVISDTQNSSAR